MARLPRISPVDIPVHLIQRGNNRQACFTCDVDHGVYAGWLKEYAQKFKVEIHAWVMMTNHVHLLCTPRQEGAVSRMMQSLGRRYVQYFNAEYGRTGTLWEGRFKSCLIEEGTYMLEAYRYIELNPVRAGIVKDPGEYHWSSYQINALGKVSAMCLPHHTYLSIGEDTSDRHQNYREFLSQHVGLDVLKELRAGTNKGMAFGSDGFKEELEALTGRRLKEKKRGRRVGWRKEEV